MYNAVGIDVSKGKSTVTVLQPGGTVIRKPFDVSHTSQNLNELAKFLDSLNGDTRIVMECTGRYHEPNKKRSQGKPYYVYMTAGANKFLRIYYGKVKECLRNLEQES